MAKQLKLLCPSFTNLGFSFAKMFRVFPSIIKGRKAVKRSRKGISKQGKAMGLINLLSTETRNAVLNGRGIKIK
jgi:hypothetical protein